MMKQSVKWGVVSYNYSSPGEQPIRYDSHLLAVEFLNISHFSFETFSFAVVINHLDKNLDGKTPMLRRCKSHKRRLSSGLCATNAA